MVSSFGNGRATIDGGKGNGIELTGCEYVAVRELAVVGCGRKDGSDGSGMDIKGTKNAEVDRVEVSGFRLGGVVSSGDAGTHITRINAHDNGFAGINVCGGYNKQRSRDVYIGSCVASNNPGDPKNKSNHSGNGIVGGELDGCVVEYCEAFNNGWDMPRQGNGPVGIWGWQADRLVVQFCISHDNKTQKGAYDGGGFDFDGGVTNSILQYNLSYNNHGAGYLLCQYPGASRWKNNICRYNVTLNDGLTTHDSGIHFWAGEPLISDALVYNNVVVNGKHAVKATHDIAGLVFRNNLFVSDGESISGPLKQARFENNLYWPRPSPQPSPQRGEGRVRGPAPFSAGRSLRTGQRRWGRKQWTANSSRSKGDPKLVLPFEAERTAHQSGRPGEDAVLPVGGRLAVPRRRADCPRQRRARSVRELSFLRTGRRRWGPGNQARGSENATGTPYATAAEAARMLAVARM